LKLFKKKALDKDKPTSLIFIQNIILSIIIACLIWIFIEIPLLESFPKLAENFIQKTGYAVEKQDSLGIPVVFYPQSGIQYNPLFVANKALADSKKLDNQAAQNSFIICTDWLMHNHIIDNNKAYFPYKFPNSTYELPNPWYSALAQATILNAVYARYKQSQDPQWKLLSQQTLASLLPEDKYKLAFETEQGGLWFAEYPKEPRPYVLNGMLAVLIELNRYNESTGDSLAQALFAKGYQTIINKLPEFDRYMGSRYDLTGKIASMAYHQMHIDQLTQIDAIQPNPILKKHISRWTLYRYIPTPIQLIFNFKARRCIAFTVFWLGILLFIIIFRHLWHRIITKTKTNT
jgi:hypothetical protein